MSSEKFAPAWLALRERVDHRSRAADLLSPLALWWRGREGSRVLDLGCGTGSNLRYLAPRLPPGQEWTLVDHDAALLEHVVDADGMSLAHLARLERVEGDLAREGLGAIHGTDLVTASALLDLVSLGWLDHLVEACRAAGSAALLALTWDGSIEWGTAATRPGDSDVPDDALVLEAVRAHQGRDKGLGAAMGPAAGAAAERSFRSAGFRTWLHPSPWRLGPDDARLACALVDGWARAATEQRPDQAERIRRWAERRRRATRAPGFALDVGHVDVLALPTARA